MKPVKADKQFLKIYSLNFGFKLFSLILGLLNIMNNGSKEIKKG
jgi:hypothetical protein